MNMYYVFSREIKKNNQLTIYARDKHKALDMAKTVWLRTVGDSTRGAHIEVYYIGPVEDWGFDTGYCILKDTEIPSAAKLNQSGCIEEFQPE